MYLFWFSGTEWCKYWDCAVFWCNSKLDAQQTQRLHCLHQLSWLLQVAFDFCRCQLFFYWDFRSEIQQTRNSFTYLHYYSLYSELLPSRNPEYFVQWMHPLCHELILQSIHFPLVSGFYKLLSLSMSIAKKTQYFQVIHICHKIKTPNFNMLIASVTKAVFLVFRT